MESSAPLITVGEDKLLAEQASKTYLTLMRETMKAISPYPIFLFITYLTTFLLFPNMALAKKTGIQGVWSTLIFILLQSLGDFTGKAIGDFRKTFNAWSMTFLMLSRFFFFYTIIMLVQPFTQDDHLLNNNVFPYINLFLLAVTNGFATSNCVMM